MKKPYEQAASIFRECGGILRMSEAIQVGVSRRTLYAMRGDGQQPDEGFLRHLAAIEAVRFRREGDTGTLDLHA